MLLRIDSKKGASLILVYALLSLVVVILGIIFSTAIQSMKASQRRLDFIRAFYAAESGIDMALQLVPASQSLLPVSPISGVLGAPEAISEYRFAISSFDGSDNRLRINSIGFVPDSFSSPRVEVELEVIAEASGDTDFFRYALYSATGLTIKGNAYTVDGDVFYDENSDFDVQHPGNITGDVDAGTPVDFLEDIDYDMLRDIALSQGLSDTYDHYLDSENWQGSNLPPDFWYDESSGMPNVVYVDGTGNVNMSGNMNLGGFIIITSGDCNISGTVSIQGCLLVLGDLNITGTADITGGVWASGTITDEDSGGADGIIIRGDAGIIYDGDYMDAVEGLNFLKDEYGSDQVRILSWHEIRRQAI
jgi:hypothetical protein